MKVTKQFKITRMSPANIVREVGEAMLVELKVQLVHVRDTSPFIPFMRFVSSDSLCFISQYSE